MSQAELERQVAAATGESRRTVHRLGFSLADPPVVVHDPEPTDCDQYLDWDVVAEERYAELAVY
jgi:hypothetical protein